jgi:hypothetical protein
MGDKFKKFQDEFFDAQKSESKTLAAELSG